MHIWLLLRPRCKQSGTACSRRAHAQPPRPVHSAGRTRLEAWEDSVREAGPSDQTPSGRCSLSSLTTSSIRPRRTGAPEIVRLAR